MCDTGLGELRVKDGEQQVERRQDGHVEAAGMQSLHMLRRRAAVLQEEHERQHAYGNEQRDHFLPQFILRLPVHPVLVHLPLPRTHARPVMVGEMAEDMETGLRKRGNMSGGQRIVACQRTISQHVRRGPVGLENEVHDHTIYHMHQR